jgi:Recombination endonuclease VII
MGAKEDKAWAKRLMDNYKLTIPMWWAIFNHQGGVCYACGQPEPVAGRRLAVDHDHASGLVRGLLCSRCNPVLGKLERAFVRFGLGKIIGLTVTRWLSRMGRYVDAEPATTALGFQHFGYAGRVGTKAHRKRVKKERVGNATHQTTNARRKAPK